MKKALVLSLVVLFAMSLTSVAFAKKVSKDVYRITEPLQEPEALPPDLAGYSSPSLSAAAADTFHLAWYGFDTGGLPDEMGWTKVDLYDQLETFWHVAGPELDGGLGPNPPFPSPNGQLVPLSGDQSMWCGKDASTVSPYCGWSLPGYGNSWDQTLTSDELVCDSLTFSYTVYWDSENGYDFSDVEWSTNANDAVPTWNRFAVSDTFGAADTRYTGHGPFPGDGGYDSFLTESHGVGPQLAGGSATGSFWLRFHCTSDGAWSGEDNLWLTDGMLLVDDVTVERRNADGSLIGSNTEDFEGEVASPSTHDAGIWHGAATPAFGHYHQLYPGVTVLQEDPCFSIFNNIWGFFDDPNITNYSCHQPDPKPLQGAMPYKNDRDQYMFNEIWSPIIDNAGTGDLYFLQFDAYSDLPTDNLQFYVWHVRRLVSGCPTKWEDDFNVYGDAGLPKQWHRHDNVNLAAFNISPFLAGNPSQFQISLGAWDYCGFVCGQFGTGACHSQAPLLDNAHVVRINVVGPQFASLHIYDFFQDTFASDGTTTGKARADIALDVQTNVNPAVLPGDSASVTVGGLTTDPHTGIGPSVYAYVAVWPQGQMGKAGADLEAPETRAAVGKRFPFVDTVVHDGVTWYCFRMDSVFTSAGGLSTDNYCVDLNDNVFTPGDTVCYIIAAADNASHNTYLSRFGQGSRGFFTTSDLWTALNSPMEFTILPASGWANGGDILYVDYADGGTSQLFYDTAFEILQLDKKVDRYDATPGRGNGLGDRVKNVTNQLINCYRKIIWDSANVSSPPIGDGTLWEKSDDLLALYKFLDEHPNNPGVFLSGNSIAQAWDEEMTGQSATDFRSDYLAFTLNDGDHKAAGEPLSPVLTGIAACFIHGGTPDQFVAYGGCPILRDFDLIDASGTSVETLASGGGAGASYGVQQETPNSNSSTARVILSGFGMNYVRDDQPGFPPDRVQYLSDVLTWLSNVVPGPIGIPDAAPRFVNNLENNRPNPFNPTTEIRYSIKDQGAVTLKVYNAAGQLVRTLINDVQTPQDGGFTVTWDGKNNAGQSVSSGVYFYKLTAKNYSETKKMVLLK